MYSCIHLCIQSDYNFFLFRQKVNNVNNNISSPVISSFVLPVYYQSFIPITNELLNGYLKEKIVCVCEN